MDLQTALISLGCFLVSAVVIYIVSILGTKEKTYEEAIKEQKQQAHQALLTARTEKALKEKKIKKFGRKSKEKSVKTNSEEDEILEEKNIKLDSIEPLIQTQKKHLEIKQTKGLFNKENASNSKHEAILKKVDENVFTTVAEVHVDSEGMPLTKTLNNTIQTKSSQETKPKKSEHAKQNGNEKNDQNIFDGMKQSEENKHEIDGKLKTGKDQSVRKEANKNDGKKADRQHDTSKKEDSTKHIQKQLASNKKHNEVTGKKIQQESAPLMNGIEDKEQVLSSPSKHPRKSKSSDIMGQDGQLNIVKVTSQVKEALMSNSEIQNLIDILLNKQQNGSFEWLQKGQKLDTVPQLKKQLAEQEQKLTEERQLSLSTTLKVKELRQELNQEKARSGQTESASKDRIDKLQLEIQALISRAKTVKEQHTAEITAVKNKSALNQGNVQKLKEEISQLKHALLQAEQQKGVAADVYKLELEVKELKTLKEQYESRQRAAERTRGELQTKIEQLQVAQTPTVDVNALQSKLYQSEQQVATMQLAVSELQTSLNKSANRQVTVETELQKLRQDLQSARSQLQDRDGQILITTEEKLGLTAEIDLLKSNQRNGSIPDDMTTQKELLLEENIKMKELVDQLQKRQNSYDKIKKEFAETKSALQQLQEDCSEKSEEIRKLNKEIIRRSSEVERLKREIETERKSNDENLLKVKAEEESKHKEFLQRIFPSVKVLPDLPFEVFLSTYEKQVAIRESQEESSQSNRSDLAELLEESESARVSLEAQLYHYKTVMNETEVILKTLQTNVEEEEESWKTKLSSKNEELAQVLEDRRMLAEENIALKGSLEQIRAAEEMQEKLKELQEKLQGEEIEKKTIETKYMQTQGFLRNVEGNERELLAATARLEQFQKEIENLRRDVEKEKQCSKELQSQNVKLNSLVKIGHDSLMAEQEVVRDLQNKLDQLQSSQNGSVNGSPSDEPLTIKQLEPSYSESNIVPDPPSSPGSSSTSSKKSKRKSKPVASGGNLSAC